MYAVENCFHWIGFHIVNRLLEEGCRVDGIDDLSTEKKENLAMFVGRNELFRHLPVIQESSGYNAIITVDDQMVKCIGRNLSPYSSRFFLGNGCQ